MPILNIADQRASCGYGSPGWPESNALAIKDPETTMRSGYATNTQSGPCARGHAGAPSPPNSRARIIAASPALFARLAAARRPVAPERRRAVVARAGAARNGSGHKQKPSYGVSDQLEVGARQSTLRQGRSIRLTVWPATCQQRA